MSWSQCFVLYPNPINSLLRAHCDLKVADIYWIVSAPFLPRLASKIRTPWLLLRGCLMLPAWKRHAVFPMSLPGPREGKGVTSRGPDLMLREDLPSFSGEHKRNLATGIAGRVCMTDNLLIMCTLCL